MPSSTMPVPDRGGGGGLGFLKTNRALNDIVSIYGNVLVEVWGCFEGVKCVLG